MTSSARRPLFLATLLTAVCLVAGTVFLVNLRSIPALECPTPTRAPVPVQCAGDAVDSLKRRLDQAEAERDRLARVVAGGDRTRVHERVGERTVIAVLMMTCKRADYLRRSLDSVFSALGESQSVGEGVEFAVVVSRDCESAEVAKLLESESFRDRVVHLHHPFWSRKSVESKNAGYEAISGHYKWALSQVLSKLRYSAAVVLEEDLEVSPDFFEYFAALYPRLRDDQTLYCVSAWNDNGVAGLAQDPKALYRSDFFPGLGWMLTREAWTKELESRWPGSYWDEFMRRPDVRKGRQCIRPEVCRTFHFGEKGGVSEGQFQSSHLSKIVLNRKFVKWTESDLSFLDKVAYDREMERALSSAKELASADELQRFCCHGAGVDLRLRYLDERHFVDIADALGLMSEWKEHAPRTAYKGVVVFRFKGSRVFLAPTRT